MPGIAAKACALRWQRQCDLIVSDANLIPPEKQFVIRPACNDVHPGLCAAKDSDVHDASIALAGSLERYFLAAFVGKFFKIKAVQDTPSSVT